MFGNLLNFKSIKENPGMLLGMLKSFGIDLKEVVPKFIPIIKEKIVAGVKHLEDKAGTPLLFMAELVPGTDIVAISMYHKLPDGQLQLWETHTTQEGEDFILKFLPNVEQLSSPANVADNAGNAAITDSAIAEPGTDSPAPKE